MAANLRLRPGTPDLASCSSLSTGDREGTPLSQRASSPDEGTFYPAADLTAFTYAGNEPQQTQHRLHHFNPQQGPLCPEADGYTGIQGGPTVDETWWEDYLRDMDAGQTEMQGATSTGSVRLNNVFDDVRFKAKEELPFNGLMPSMEFPAPFQNSHQASQMPTFDIEEDTSLIPYNSGISSGSSSPINPETTRAIARCPPATARTARTPATCDWCGTPIKRAGDIPRHKRSSCSKKPLGAPSEQPFQCSSCSHRHMRRDKMQKHCREYHDALPGTERFTLAM